MASTVRWGCIRVPIPRPLHPPPITCPRKCRSPAPRRTIPSHHNTRSSKMSTPPTVQDCRTLPRGSNRRRKGTTTIAIRIQDQRRDLDTRRPSRDDLLVLSSSLMFDSCIPVSQWTISDLVFPSIYIPPILSFTPAYSYLRSPIVVDLAWIQFRGDACRQPSIVSSPFTGAGPRHRRLK